MRLSILLSLSGTLMVSVAALAQTPPDAGSLLQQLDRERPSLLPGKLTPTKPAEPPALKPGAITVTVKKFHFAGNTLLSSEQLAAAVAPFLERPLDFRQLQAAAVAVANAYREKGWVVRAYLPEQDIRDGIVTIQVVEAVFAGLRFDGRPTRRVARETVARYFARQQTGQPLNPDALDRALLLADDLPGVIVGGSLQEGSRTGETALAVTLRDEALVVGAIAADNSGSRSTGSERLAANLNLQSPFGFGDLLTAQAVLSEGSNYLRLAATAPVGADGWRIGANASYLDYRLVAAEFTALRAKGNSSTAGLEASYPVIRSRLQNLYFSSAFDHKEFDNESAGSTTTRYQLDALTLGLAGNRFDNWGGGGANSGSLDLVAGKLDLDGSPNQAADALTTRTAGDYVKLRYAFSRQQVIRENLSLYAALAGQLASKNLDSAEKFYLGGPYGVRAYPTNEGGGAEGQLFTLELRWRLAEGWSLTGFYDWGHVTVNRKNRFAGAPTLNDYSLQGAGLSVGWQTRFGPSFKATWARRIGDNPNPTATGQDQDGSLTKDRFWLTASLPF